MAAYFANPTGGLIPSVVANPTNFSPTPATFGQGASASFSVGPVLAASVASQSGYSLIGGDNYQMGQIQPFITPTNYNLLGDSISQQVQQVGAASAFNFISQNTPLTPAFSNPLVTTAGLATQAALATIGIPQQIVNLLPTSEYSNRNYNLNDVTFTLLPANTGPQSVQPPQTSPTVPLNVAFNSKNQLYPSSALSALKQDVCLNFAATGKTMNSAAAFGKTAPTLYSPSANAQVASLKFNQ